MTNRFYSIAALCLGVAACWSVSASTSKAAITQITSADFHFAFGSTQVGATWTDIENVNSPPTQGHFTFSPAPTGGQGSGNGPKFVGGVLTNGVDGDFTAWIGSNFLVPITASYNGPAPGNASGTPNYKLRVEITNLSIYGVRTAGASTPTTMAWDEVTIGHTQTSPSVGLTTVANSLGFLTATNFTQLAWDPADYDVTLASINDTFMRTFDILPGTSSDFRYADGLQISGRVILIYDAVEIPEPSSIALIGMGIAGLGLIVAKGRKRRK